MHLRGAAPSALFASLLAITSPQLASAFYLPGVAPTTYHPHDDVPLYVNSLKPTASAADGQLHAVAAFDFYHPSFHFCEPSGGPEYRPESLGSILFGDRIMTSPFKLNMLDGDPCKHLCRVEFDRKEMLFINRRIKQGYSQNWLVDGLPAGQMVPNTTYYSHGFALGRINPDSHFVEFHNHFDIIIQYHEVSGNPNDLRVVGVIVQPESRDYGEMSAPQCTNDDLPPVTFDETMKKKVQFTYGVYWEKSETPWATRWDKYLHVFDPKIHWFSLVNSTVIVVFLVLTVVSVLFRLLKKDIARYNGNGHSIHLEDLSGTSALEDGGIQDDSGWKLVHGDVFRTPRHSLILSIFLGNGAQLFVMTGFTIMFALLGFLSPSNRGSLGTIMILLYTILGFIGGYTSARVYKSMNGEKWKLNIALTPLLVPGIVFSAFFLLDLFLWAKQSSGAVPFTTMLVIVSIWFVISVPLSFAGSWVGFRSRTIEAPVRTNQIPRQIPPTTTYLRPIPSMLLVGILPFGAIFVELYFILNSIWFSRFYYMFGFLFLCYGLMIITCASGTVLLVYFLLCSENYHWQWRSFLAAGASAIYVFANALIYWATKLQFTELTPTVLYVGYSLLISFMFFILTGSIGFFSSWWFVQRIYRSIKID